MGTEMPSNIVRFNDCYLVAVELTSHRVRRILENSRLRRRGTPRNKHFSDVRHFVIDA